MSATPPDHEYTAHARKVLEERCIDPAWLERTLAQPEWTEPDPQDVTVVRYFRQIPEYGHRVLRVAVNTKVDPWRIVSVFFDRNAKGKP
jgi:hypothetical protein